MTPKKSLFERIQTWAETTPLFGKQAYSRTDEGRDTYRQTTHTPLWKQPLFLIVAGIVVLLVLIYSVIYTALPGSPLYSTKTQGMEEFFAKLRVSGSSQTEYRLTLLERRFHEVERLAKKNEPVSEEAANAFITETTNEVTVIRGVIETNENLPLDEVLDTMRDAGAILLATEYIVEEHEHLVLLEDPVEDLRQETEGTNDDLTALFTMRTPTEELRTYITGQLELLTSEIEKADLNAEELAETVRYIERTQKAMAADNATRAITSIHDALKTVSVARYLDLKEEESTTEEPAPAATSTEGTV